MQNNNNSGSFPILWRKLFKEKDHRQNMQRKTSNGKNILAGRKWRFETKRGLPRLHWRFEITMGERDEKQRGKEEYFHY